MWNGKNESRCSLKRSSAFAHRGHILLAREMELSAPKFSPVAKQEEAKLFMFDLDNTLIHACKTAHPEFHYFTIEIGGDTLFVHIRPGALDLLRYMLIEQDVLEFGIWTAGTHPYARKIVDGLVETSGTTKYVSKIRIIQSRGTTKSYQNNLVKDLAVTAFLVDKKLENVFLVDDNPIHLPFNRNQILLIPPFHVYDKTDYSTLRTIQTILEHCATEATS